MSNYESKKPPETTVVSTTNLYFPLCEREPNVPISKRRLMSYAEKLNRIKTAKILRKFIEETLEDIEPIDTTKSEKYRKNIPLAMKNIWASLGVYNMEKDETT